MMNEKIKEIALQAGDDWDHTLESDRQFLHKFAELIVKECAQFVEDKFDFCGDEILVKQKMLEHFGVAG